MAREQQCAIVTGGSSGIGRAIVDRLLEGGARRSVATGSSTASAGRASSRELVSTLPYGKWSRR
jgi:NAD(P)-dependent dehydrogenase (short-subunit alcohol dehydrogenase family)